MNTIKTIGRVELGMDSKAKKQSLYNDPFYCFPPYINFSLMNGNLYTVKSGTYSQKIEMLEIKPQFNTLAWKKTFNHKFWLNEQTIINRMALDRLRTKGIK